jgi:hypothetical protein
MFILIALFGHRRRARLAGFLLIPLIEAGIRKSCAPEAFHEQVPHRLAAG